MEFKEEIQIDNLSVDEALQPLIVPEKVRFLFEHTSMKEQSFSGWNKVEDSNIIRHTVKIAEAAARDHLASIGLYIPPDYALNSMGNMMVDRYIPTQVGTHQLGETWCEGQTFEFIREYNEQKIFDDRCKIAVQNKNVISYSLTKHLLKKTGTMIVKKPQFRFIDRFIKQDDLQTSIVYRLRGKTVYPTWQIQYHNYIFHYDLE